MPAQKDWEKGGIHSECFNIFLLLLFLSFTVFFFHRGGPVLGSANEAMQCFLSWLFLQVPKFYAVSQGKSVSVYLSRPNDFGVVSLLLYF